MPVRRPCVSSPSGTKPAHVAAYEPLIYHHVLPEMAVHMSSSKAFRNQ